MDDNAPRRPFRRPTGRLPRTLAMLELFHEGEFYRYGPHSRDLGAGWAEVELHHVGTVDSESLGWVPVEDDE